MEEPNSNPIETKLFKLMAEKQNLESRINEFGNILAENGNVGMKGSFIDAEGYPRNDIVVYQVRLARQQIICMQNDHKALMIEIEKLMHQLHAETKDAHEQQLPCKELLKPFLIVTNVAVGSPAEVSGLRNNDKICQFGTTTAENFNRNLITIENIVFHMMSKKILLKVKRNNEFLDLQLTPNRWSGPGLLGCKIILADM